MNTATQTTPKYSIKALKTGPSREWGPNGSFTCNLYLGTKKIAECFEAGDGGQMDISYTSAEDEKAFKASFAGKKLTDYGMDLDWTDDLEIGDLVEKLEDDRHWKRKCKHHTLFRLEGQKAGIWNSIKSPYNATVQAFLDSKYGDTITQIMNKRFI